MQRADETPLLRLIRSTQLASQPDLPRHLQVGQGLGPGQRGARREGQKGCIRGRGALRRRYRVGGGSCLESGDKLVTDERYSMGACSIRKIYKWNKDAAKPAAPSAS